MTLGIQGDAVVFSLTSYIKHSHRILHYSACIMSLYLVWYMAHLKTLSNFHVNIPY